MFLDRIAGLLERGYDSTQAWGEPRETTEASLKRKIKVTLALYFIDILYREVEISVCNQFNSTQEKRSIIYTQHLGVFSAFINGVSSDLRSRSIYIFYKVYTTPYDLAVTS